MSFYLLLYYITIFYIILHRHIIFYYIRSYHVIIFYITSHRLIILHYIISQCYIMPHHNISYYVIIFMSCLQHEVPPPRWQHDVASPRPAAGDRRSLGHERGRTLRRRSKPGMWCCRWTCCHTSPCCPRPTTAPTLPRASTPAATSRPTTAPSRRAWDPPPSPTCLPAYLPTCLPAYLPASLARYLPRGTYLEDGEFPPSPLLPVRCSAEI